MDAASEAQVLVIGLDPYRAPGPRPWKCVVIGGGIRNEDQLDLLKQMINLVRRHAPDAAIASNGSPADTFDVAARWVDLPGPGTAAHAD